VNRVTGVVTRARVVLVLKIGVSAALLALLLAKAGWTQIGSTLAHAHVGWLALGLLLGVAAAGLQANQWRGLLLALGLERSFARCLRLDTEARVFDAALPSAIGGDVVRVTLVATAPAERAAAATAVLLRRVFGLPGLALLMAVSLAASAGLPYAGRIRPVAAVAVLGFVGLLAVLAGAGRFARSVPLPLPAKVRGMAATVGAARAQARDRDGAERRPFVRATLRGLAFWTTVVLSQWCFMAAVGIDVPPQYAALVVTTVNALSLLPISLGGYGLREGAFSAFLAVGGLATTGQGAAVGVILSAQTLLFGVVGGLVRLFPTTVSDPAVPAVPDPAVPAPVVTAPVVTAAGAPTPVPSSSGSS